MWGWDSFPTFPSVFWKLTKGKKPDGSPFPHPPQPAPNAIKSTGKGHSCCPCAPPMWPQLWFSVAQGSLPPAHHCSPGLLQSAPTQAVSSRIPLPPQAFLRLEAVSQKLTLITSSPSIAFKTKSTLFILAYKTRSSLFRFYLSSLIACIGVGGGRDIVVVLTLARPTGRHHTLLTFLYPPPPFIAPMALLPVPPLIPCPSLCLDNS